MPLARTSALLFHASCHPAANGWLRRSLHDASRQSVNGGIEIGSNLHPTCGFEW